MNRFKDLSIAALIAGTAMAASSGVVLASANGGGTDGEPGRGPAPELSMEEVISQLKASGARRILESEFEHEDGRAVYEVEYVDADGKTREVYIDGMDGETIRSESGEDEDED